MYKNLDLELMRKIFEIPSPTGYTHHVIEFLEKKVQELGYSTSKNKKGNLIVDVKGESDYTIGLSAHVDTLGLMVKSIDGSGNLRFTRLGGLILPTVDGEYCSVVTREGATYTGTILSTSPSVHVYKDAQSASRTEDNMYIRLDEEVSSKADTLKLGISSGDIVYLDPKFTITSSNFVKTRFLDDKASVFMLLTVLRCLKEKEITPTHNLKVIFSTYEEVGHGASNIPEVDELLAVDMGCIGSDLSCTEEMVSICAKDSGGPYDYDMITSLINIAKERELNYAVDIYPYYGSDGTAALRAGNDIKCALIGAGIQASHGMERTHLNGVTNTIKLIMGYITK